MRFKNLMAAHSRPENRSQRFRIETIEKVFFFLRNQIRQWEGNPLEDREAVFCGGGNTENSRLRLAMLNEARPPKTQNCEISLSRTTLDFDSTCGEWHTHRNTDLRWTELIRWSKQIDSIHVKFMNFRFDRGNENEENDDRSRVR